MRRWIPWLTFAAGLVVGAGGVRSQLRPVPGPFHFMTWRFRGVPPEYFPDLPVAVACEDVPAGAVVRQEQICQRGLPEGYVLHAMLKPEQARSVIGLTARKPLEAGEPLQAAFFAPADPVHEKLAPSGH